MPLPDTRTDEEIFLAWLRNLRRPGADEVPAWIGEVAGWLAAMCEEEMAAPMCNGRNGQEWAKQYLAS